MLLVAFIHQGAWSVWQGHQQTKNWEPSSVSLICQSRNHILTVLSVVTSGPGWKWNQFFKPLITCQEIALWEHGVCLWQCVAHLNWSFIILLSCSCAREWQKPEVSACGYSTCSLNHTQGWDMTRPQVLLVLTHAGLHEEAEIHSCFKIQMLCKQWVWAGVFCKWRVISHCFIFS